MTRLARLLACGTALFVLTAGPALAQDRGTPDEARTMAEEAAGHLQEAGPETAFQDFNQGEAWHDRDLYVFVFGPEGEVLAHGANQDLIGENLMDATDSAGNHFVQDIVSVEGEGWVDYEFEDPQTGEPAPKRSYVVEVDDEYFVGVGAYAE